MTIIFIIHWKNENLNLEIIRRLETKIVLVLTWCFFYTYLIDKHLLIINSNKY